ncbi:MAG: membrane protein insertion efficiency factor YidD [Rickettsiaceae bacterium]|nr:membrane protein insertion efficiency factor YidD [Rickettsiaceae bacterium]
MPYLLKSIFLICIKLYQIILSPYLGPSCRFLPTCSEYSYRAINKYGVIKGIFLSIKRIARCNPFFKGGIDEV